MSLVKDSAMDEAQWLSCEDPRKMLEGLRRGSERKLRLFACAFWRLWWFESPHEPGPDGGEPEIADLLRYAER